MGVPGLSLDVLGILGIRGYSDTRGGDGWESLECPRMFWVSWAYGDTQTQEVLMSGSPWTVLGCSGYLGHTRILRHKGWWCVGVTGLSLDVLGILDIRGYSDTRGGGGLNCPILGIQGYSDTRGGGGWESLDCPWMFWVSWAYGDTQTQGVVVGGSLWIVLDDILGVQDMFAWTSIGTPRQSG